MSENGIRLPSARERSTKITRPQGWFAGGEKQRADGSGSAPGAKLAETDANIYVPTDNEKDILMRGQMCGGCEYFRHREGQERIIGDHVIDMLAADLKMNAMMESLNPTDLGNCLAKKYLLTHHMAGHDCSYFKPQEGHAKNVWNRAKELVSIGRDQGSIP